MKTTKVGKKQVKKKSADKGRERERRYFTSR